MPKIGLNNPPMAPAILQAIAKDLGCDTKVLDINLSFQKHFSENSSILYDWCELEQPLSQSQIALVQKFTETLNLEEIFSADIIGISVFSMHSFAYTDWFLKTYREQIKGKIVIGGSGASVMDYGKIKYEQNLVDYYVVNEGELAWKAILMNNLPHQGVNGPNPGLANFDDVPFPDYSGYELDEYINSKTSGRTIGVEGSRGCVRDCTFCDIKNFWNKYKFKDGVSLAQELIELKNKFSVKHFFFNDSLVNGSDKAFRDFIKTLAEYNSTADDKVVWSGYYIIKRKGTYKEQDWINLRNSGAKSLYIGIESGSEKVRDHMKKKFSNDDIRDAMKNIQRYGIRCTWLMIVGYPTESEDDFNQTLDLLREFQPMALDRTIDTVALGMTLGIIPGSPLDSMKDELNITSQFSSNISGVIWSNENSDFRTRVLRRITAEKLVRELGYNSWVGDNDVINFFEQKLKDLEEGRVVYNDIAEYHG